MRSIITFAALLLCVATSPAADNAGALGTWEGDSTCTIPGSPCHNEHVLYKILPHRKGPAELTLDASKVVNGELQFMGTLGCHYHPDRSDLVCSGNSPRQDLWEFHISNDVMSGTLKIGAEQTLYRRIRLRRLGTAKSVH